MVQRTLGAAAAAQILLQDAIDAAEIIGRWDYDVPNDRVYGDALVALIFNINPIEAEAGAPLSAFLNGIHPDDRDRAARTIAQSASDGLSCTLEYRVCSADGVTRWILDRGRIAQDRAGRPTHGSGILVDISQTKSNTAVHDPYADLRGALERAAEHGLAIHAAIRELPPSILHSMSDMLLLEIGRRLSGITDDKRYGKAN